MVPGICTGDCRGEIYRLPVDSGRGPKASRDSRLPSEGFSSTLISQGIYVGLSPVVIPTKCKVTKNDVHQWLRDISHWHVPVCTLFKGCIVDLAKSPLPETPKVSHYSFMS